MQKTTVFEQTLGQELIDLKKAKEGGAITDLEYKDLKEKLKARLTH